MRPFSRLKLVPRHKKAIADEQVHQAIADALMAGDLPPETRLGEHQLATIFGVTRARVRAVLHRLVHEKRLVLIPNRGVFVPMPSPEEAREVYFARRLLEKGCGRRIGHARPCRRGRSDRGACAARA